MKRLFDQNISHRLSLILADIYPDSQNVREVGMKAVDDTIIWEYARRNGFMIVSKDSDFHQHSLFNGLATQGYLGQTWQLYNPSYRKNPRSF